MTAHAYHDAIKHHDPETDEELADRYDDYEKHLDDSVRSDR